MITESKIEKIKLKDKGFTWVNINNPDERATSYLKHHYKFHPLDLEDCLSDIQRSKIDEYENYLFIVLHVPVKRAGQHKLHISELDIFISHNFVITLHEDDPTVNKVFEKCKKKRKFKEEYLQKGSGYFLYMIVDDLFESCFPILDDLGHQLNDLESEVFDSGQSKDRIKEVLLLKKDLINFRRVIMPERAIVAQLEHKNKKFLPENLTVYFDDIVDKIEKMWNNLENLQELAVSLQETNESVISHNTNNIIKILTTFSVIMLPLTVVTGFYGMNVDGLPFVGSENPVLIIMGMLAIIALAMLGYFRYKRWL